jgi:hypothetical protein
MPYLQIRAARRIREHYTGRFRDLTKKKLNGTIRVTLGMETFLCRGNGSNNNNNNNNNDNNNSVCQKQALTRCSVYNNRISRKTGSDGTKKK